MGRAWKKDTWEGLERGTEEMMEFYFNLKYIKKKEQKIINETTEFPRLIQI